MAAPSSWIMFFCVIGCVAVLLLLHFGLGRRDSLRQQIYEARLVEQEHIARAMHDWLLQGTQGLMLRVQAASQQQPADSETRRLLEHTLDRADRLIATERSCLSRSRAHGLDTSVGLEEAIARMGQVLAAGHPGTFRLAVVGTPRGLRPEALVGACLITRDLLAGAYAQRHVDRVQLSLDFARGGLVVRFVIEPMALDSALGSARLRACSIGAKLEVWRRLGAGHELDLHVPAGIAYLSPVAAIRRLRIERLRRADA